MITSMIYSIFECIIDIMGAIDLQDILRVLEVINRELKLSQKKIAEYCGISTGKVNYIISDLIEKNMFLARKQESI